MKQIGMKARSGKDGWLVLTQAGNRIATVSTQIIDQERFAYLLAGSGDMQAALREIAEMAGAHHIASLDQNEAFELLRKITYTAQLALKKSEVR